jgi:integrase
MVGVDFELPTGERVRERKVSPVQTRRGAEAYEGKLRQAMLDGSYFKEEVPTFDKWFNGRFWEDWVLKGKKPNKPSEKESKESIFRIHLKDAFGQMPLDKIDDTAISEFRAGLEAKGLSPKRVNNILAVLSTPLRFAAKKHIIPWAPDVGLLEVERPEIEVWGFDEYAAFLAAAEKMSPVWYAAACLGGEAGHRIGEIKALDWKRDLDMVAKTITINRQTRHGHTGTPKGRTRRTAPMPGMKRAATSPGAPGESPTGAAPRAPR